GGGPVADAALPRRGLLEPRGRELGGGGPAGLGGLVPVLPALRHLEALAGRPGRPARRCGGGDAGRPLGRAFRRDRGDPVGGSLPCGAGTMAGLAAQVLAKARAAGLRIATAESCTGGMVAAALT